MFSNHTDIFSPGYFLQSLIFQVLQLCTHWCYNWIHVPTWWSFSLFFLFSIKGSSRELALCMMCPKYDLLSLFICTEVRSLSNVITIHFFFTPSNASGNTFQYQLQKYFFILYPCFHSAPHGLHTLLAQFSSLYLQHITSCEHLFQELICTIPWLLALLLLIVHPKMQKLSTTILFRDHWCICCY